MGLDFAGKPDEMATGSVWRNLDTALSCPGFAPLFLHAQLAFEFFKRNAWSSVIFLTSLFKDMDVQ